MCANTKQKCAKIILKWDSVPTKISVSLHMDKMNSTRQARLQRKLTEQRNANLSGKKGHVDTDSGVSSSTTSTKLTKTADSSKLPLFSCAEAYPSVKVDCLVYWRNLTEKNNTLTHYL